MTAPSTSEPKPIFSLSDLRRGRLYRTYTRAGGAIGEYLGLETPHGTSSILLRSQAGTESIAVRDIVSVHLLAA